MAGATYILSRRGLIQFFGLAAVAMVDLTPASASAVVASSAWSRGIRIGTTLPPSSLAGYSVSGAWSPDSTRIAYRFDVGPGGIVDARSGAVIARLPAPRTAGEGECIHYAPDGKSILLGGLLQGDPTDLPVLVRIVDAETGQVMRALPAPMIAFNGTQAAPRGNTAKQICYDSARRELLFLPFYMPYPATQGPPFKGLLRYRVESDGTLRPMNPIHFQSVLAGELAMQPGGSHIAITAGGGRFEVLDRKTGAVMTRVEAFPDPSQLVDLAYSPDGSLLLAAMSGALPRRGAPLPEREVRHKIIGYRAPDYREIQAIDVELPWIDRIAFHPDGNVFTVGYKDAVAVFDRTSFALTARVDIAGSTWTTLEFSPDGRSLLALGTDRNLILTIN